MTLDDIAGFLESQRRSQDHISTDVLEALPCEPHDPDSVIEIHNPEFTSLCPKTGLPDFGSITIRYIPYHHIVELKSLKYYFMQFRSTGIFYEQLTRLIRDHLVAKLDPMEMTITAEFTPRGGLSSRVISSYRKPQDES